MKQEYHQLLKPEIINSISGLALISRVIVDGYLSGSNHSRRIGHGMEFSQYRGYEQGDDLRLLDWKMLARSGKYFIKQSEVETNITIKFILDSSNSMNHTEKGLSKIDYVKVLVASLAYLAQKQGDAIGLYALNNQDTLSVFPKVEKQHFNRLLLNLVGIKTEGEWPKTSINLERFQDRSHRELLVFITDMYQTNHELEGFIKRLKNKRNELIVLQIMGEQELDLDYKGTIMFEDLESKTQLKVDPDTIKVQYKKSIDKALEDIKDSLLIKDIGYQLFKMGMPLEDTLNLFLKRRAKLS